MLFAEVFSNKVSKAFRVRDQKGEQQQWLRAESDTACKNSSQTRCLRKGPLSIRFERSRTSREVINTNILCIFKGSLKNNP